MLAFEQDEMPRWLTARGVPAAHRRASSWTGT